MSIASIAPSAFSQVRPVTLRFAAAPKSVPERRHHAHIYYDKQTQGDAAIMLQALKDEFKKELAQGDMSVADLKNPPIGPHLKANLAVHFKESALGRLMHLLYEKSGKLLVLLHPDTGNDPRDHQKPFWMGVPDSTLPLDKKFFDEP